MGLKYHKYQQIHINHIILLNCFILINSNMLYHTAATITKKLTLLMCSHQFLWSLFSQPSPFSSYVVPTNPVMCRPLIQQMQAFPIVNPTHIQPIQAHPIVNPTHIRPSPTPIM